jgi:pyruvate/2-oxoglutarate dehydrogenase complex dihydrolipoamide acyltransferase (E2) component
MMKVIIPEHMWEENKEGVIVSWIYKNGAEVVEGDPICEVIVEKIQSDIIAPASGKLSIISEAEDVVQLGQQIATIS